jgi:hypothetical protein
MNTSPEQLMVSQLMKNQKINDLIEMASQYVDCNEECQKNKTSQELYQKYADTQNAVKNASTNLEKYKKKYYIYTYGDEYYDNLRKKELSENASTIINELSTEFKAQIDNAYAMNKLFVATVDTSGNCINQYPIFQEYINNQLYSKMTQIGIDNREVYYTDMSIDRLKLWGKFLLFVYYFCVLMFMILCIPRTFKDFFWKYGLVIGLLFLYPFLIDKIVVYFYNNNYNIIFIILYILILLVIILFILYKIAKTFKYTLVGLMDVVNTSY